MRTRPRATWLLALSLCGPASGQSSEPAPASLEPLTRLVEGEWRVRFHSGTEQVETWRTGPGGHALVAWTHGADAVGGPWRSLTVYYRHPGLRELRLLGLAPDIPGLGRGVSEGLVELGDDRAEARFDLVQAGHPGKLREMGWTLVLEGADRYRTALLEASGGPGLEPLGEWEYARSRELTPVTPASGEDARPAGALEGLAPLLGTRAGEGVDAAGGALALEAAVAWIPYVGAAHARVVASGAAAEPAPLLEAWLYRHPADPEAAPLRCLILSSDGGVHEGTASVLDGGSLQLELKRYVGDRLVPLAARLDPAPDGTLRARAWSLADGERALLLDVHHRAPEAALEAKRGTLEQR